MGNKSKQTTNVGKTFYRWSYKVSLEPNCSNASQSISSTFLVSQQQRTKQTKLKLKLLFLKFAIN
jgi:hypothetical protein